MLFRFTELYQFDGIIQPIEVADRIIIAFVTSFLFMLAIAFALKVSTEYSRIWMASFALAACATTLSLRIGIGELVRMLADRQMFARRVVIIGAGEQAHRLLERISSTSSQFIALQGIFGDDQSASTLDGVPIIGPIDQALEFVRREQVDDVFIALPWSADEALLRLIRRLRELPTNVYLSSDLIGFRTTFREPPSHFGELPLFEIMGKPLSDWDRVAKTVEDYVLASIGTVLLIPVFALIALAVKLESPGPALFRQTRLGFNNEKFEIYKFRTMYHERSTAEKTIQAQRNDPRITRLGRWLRRTSLDELPQFLNVLNGTMSLVGPRPHAVDHNEEFAQQIRGYFARHRVKPGITGWAQVKGLRGETDTVEKMEARVAADIYYTENWSLLLDVQILARTVVICLIGKNAY